LRLNSVPSQHRISISHLFFLPFPSSASNWILQLLAFDGVVEENGRDHRNIKGTLGIHSNMGNEQSSPNPRRGQNKLSKPRTNSSGNVLNTVVPHDTSRDNSQFYESSRKSRYSLFTSEGQGEYVEEGKEKRPKRRGLFRSRSSQARNRAELDLDPGITIESVDPNPVEAPVRRYSVVNHSNPTHSVPDLTMQRYVKHCYTHAMTNL
jgi:hypothetical protein